MKVEGEDQVELVLYKNKAIPRRKSYRLSSSVCGKEVDRFIDNLKQKFGENYIQVIEKDENISKIQINSKSIEEPSSNLTINLREDDGSTTNVNLDLDFKPYYKLVIRAGLTGILVVFAVLTVSIGAWNLQNLLSLGYIFGSIGLFGIGLMVLWFFAWNKTQSFQISAIDAFYWRLDSLEGDVIDEALQRFREKEVLEKPVEKLKTCYHCESPIPSQKEAGEVVCLTCQKLFLTCSVCLLNINYKETILLCPHCSSASHRDHFREWLKIKNFCPYCKQEISEAELKEGD